MGWVLQNGQLVLFFVQIAYWIVIAVAAIWATLLFKKLVDFKTGTGKPAGETQKPVSVEEFTD